ncbi:AsmA family protein [Enterovibrio coralii]|uniref:AsmA domain-containing protein n=1 Tax=Enterovibrio coralii TaxID=294935 RepID=A0A135IAN8_9GAMM|nr:AsmA family protein [Enterovibrio coralii]KXF82530.1 hypothetical protein ATN88_21040 [Enterovibrio coralii]
MRLLAKLFASVIIVVAVALLTVVALLHTQYGLTMAKHAVSTFSDYELTADELRYDITKPFTLTFIQPELLNSKDETGADSYRANYVAASFAPLSFIGSEPTLNSVVIKGATFTDQWQQSLPKALIIKHMALDDISYAGKTVAFKEAAIQLTDWQNSASPWGDWQGQFLFSTPMVEVDGLPISNLLLDSERDDDAWEIWGISFNSPWGNITGSATLADSRQWLFHQLTLSDAQLEHSDALTRVVEQWQAFTKDNEITFRRLDLLDISASFDTVTVEHLNASLQGVTLRQGQPLFSTTSALLSFNTSLLRYNDWVMTDMLAEASLSGAGIEVNAFSTKFDEEGFLSFAGTLSPSALELDNLIVSGLSLNAEDQVFQSSLGALSALKDISLDNVTIKHTSVVHLDPTFPLQVVGLNLRGQNLTVKKGGESGLWHGKLSASAASASINRIPVSSPYFSMKSDNGKWQLDPLSLSFIQGQLSAKADIDLSKSSAPWHVTASGLSIPNDLYLRWIGLPLGINGEHDIDVSLSGLASDEDSFAYSLSGELSATPHRMWINADKGQSLSQGVLSVINHRMRDESAEPRPLATGGITLLADRGRITLHRLSSKKTTRA